MERLTDKQINDAETLLGTRAVEAERYYKYYKGENYAILTAPAKKEPDNRVPCAFAKKLVDTMKGYGFKAGRIRYTTEGDYITSLKEVFDENDEELLTAEIATDTLVTGRGYEVLRVDKELGIRMYRIVPEAGIMVYDGTLQNRPVCFIHNMKENKRTIYYDDVFIEQEKKGDKWEVVEEKAHPFGLVPAIDYRADMHWLPLFYCVIRIMDEMDKVVSNNYANDLERFASAYLLLLKRVSNVIEADGKTAAQKIAEMRMFEGLGEGGTITDVNQAVGFLTKPSRGTDIAETADRYERYIYDIACILNPNDFKGGPALSGRAYEMKALFMELRMADIEAYFSKGLQRRITLIGNALKDLEGIEPEMVTIQWQRNLPTDFEYYANAASLLKGIVSDETILGMMPADIVPDVAAEIERLGAQGGLGDFEE
jgi:SPP1 family phage portal protein